MTNPKVERVCPRCATVFKGDNCTHCGWGIKKGDSSREHFCKCNARAFHRVDGEWICLDCYSTKYEAEYEYKATREQVARFLIRQGSNSPHWKNAKEEQRQDAVKYYKEGKL